MQRAPGLPCSLFCLGATFMQTSGASRREKAESHPAVILRSGVFAASRRMAASPCVASILRGSQGLAPQDDVRNGFIGSFAGTTAVGEIGICLVTAEIRRLEAFHIAATEAKRHFAPQQK